MKTHWRSRTRQTQLQCLNPSRQEGSRCQPRQKNSPTPYYVANLAKSCDMFAESRKMGECRP
jgi:hypothetical protein